METQYDKLAQIYDFEWKDLEGDIDFAVEYSKKCGSPILELAVGTGRVAIPIARQGLEIFGIDNSINMINIGLRKIAQLPEEISSKITFIHDNMCNFLIKRKFKFIFVSFNSFLLLTTRKEQDDCLRAVHNHLTDDGLLMIDIFSPNFKLCAEEKSEIRFLRHFYFEPENKTIIQWEYVERNMAEQLMSIDFLYEEYDRNGNLNKSTRHLDMAIIFRFEMQMMLEKNGFEIVEFFGNYDKSEFTVKSPQMIYICKKKL